MTDAKTLNVPPDSRDVQAQTEALRLRTRNRDQFRRAESIVAALAELDVPDHVALYAQATAHLGSSRPTEDFTFPVLEKCLSRVAATLPTPASRQESGTGLRVLHVATEVPFPQGGHSRFLERWIRLDTGRVHSLALTSPRNEVDPSLEAAVTGSGGRIIRLAPGSSSFRRRAVELRDLAADEDLVILHTHDYDVVASLALGWSGRPPTIRVNHNGYLPWLGREVADAIACGRPAAVDLCVARRGIAREACAIVPVPPPAVRATADVSDRERVRSQLGIGADALVLLTVASEYKFRPIGSRDLRRFVANAMMRHPEAIWLVAGANPGAAWREIEQSPSGTRVRCLGVRSDIAALHAAADIYLDSWPFTSQTSLIDAGAQGIPLVAPRWHGSSAEILSAWGNVVGDAVNAFDDMASFEALFGRFADPNWRRRAGAAARAACEQMTAEAWLDKAEAAYALAIARVADRTVDGFAPVATPPQRDPEELDFCLAHLFAGDEEWRTFVNWHREITEYGAAVRFPGDETTLADGSGLTALVGLLELTIRDFESYVASLVAQAKQPRG